jgi:hypothetical protein
MQGLKSGLGVAGAVIPVLYCGGLYYYFSNVETFTGVPVLGDELGATKLGLAIVGLLFVIPLAWKIYRLANPPAKPGSGKGARAADPLEGERSDFDPDAAIARYLANRPEAAEQPQSPPASFGVARPAPRPGGFGRKQL